MFSSKDNNTSSPAADFNILAAGTVLTGELASQTNIRIDGTVNGPVTTTGRVVVGEKGVVVGDLTCGVADIAGKIKGKVTCSTELILRATCSIECQLEVKTLTVEPGAKFEGTCSMIKGGSAETKSK